MGLENRSDSYLREAHADLRARHKQAEIDRTLREARQAEAAPWRSALASSLRAAAERLEPRPAAKGHL